MNTISAKHVPTKNTNNVWAVFVEGQEEIPNLSPPRVIFEVSTP